MDNLLDSLFIPLLLFGFSCMLSIFASDIRQMIINKYMDIRYRNITRYNKELDDKIEHLQRLEKPSVAIGYFASSILASLLLISLTLFFGIMMILKSIPIIASLTFFICWYGTIIFTGREIDIAYQVSLGEKAVTALEKKKKIH